MIVKLKISDVERAVKEYVEKLFPNVLTEGITYSKKQKGDSVVVEVEVKPQEKAKTIVEGA
jgi:hypothetical protein